MPDEPNATASPQGAADGQNKPVSPTKRKADPLYYVFHADGEGKFTQLTEDPVEATSRKAAIGQAVKGVAEELATGDFFVTLAEAVTVHTRRVETQQVELFE